MDDEGAKKRDPRQGRHATSAWDGNVRVRSSRDSSSSETRVVGEDVREITISDGERLDEDRGALEGVRVPKSYYAVERVVDQMIQRYRQFSKVQSINEFTCITLLGSVDEGRIRDNTFGGLLASVGNVLLALYQVRETNADISRVGDEVSSSIDEAEARTVDIKSEEREACINRALKVYTLRFVDRRGLR